MSMLPLKDQVFFRHYSTAVTQRVKSVGQHLLKDAEDTEAQVPRGCNGTYNHRVILAVCST